MQMFPRVRPATRTSRRWRSDGITEYRMFSDGSHRRTDGNRIGKAGVKARKRAKQNLRGRLARRVHRVMVRQHVRALVARYGGEAAMGLLHIERIATAVGLTFPNRPLVPTTDAVFA